MTIRREPDDFVVEESLTGEALSRLARLPDHERPHAVYELSKTSLTTPEAVRWLAKSLTVREGQISYAGLKDKHARTTQFVSISRDVASGFPERIEGLNGRGWSARLIGWSPVELSASAIERNRFTIVVRDISIVAAHEMSRRANILTLRDPEGESKPAPALEAAGVEKPVYAPRPRRLLLVNYFGDQRFGSARHGKGWIAEHLVRAEFEQALRLSIGTPARKETGVKREFSRLCAAKWGEWAALADELPRCPERRAVEALAAGKSFRDAFAALPAFFQLMCVEAHQSFLWNEMVRAFVYAKLAVSDVLEADDPFGVMAFPRSADVPLASHILAAPMLEPMTVLDETWKDIVLRVLAERSLSLDMLRIPGLRRPAYGDASRPVFVVASEFTMSPPETDELSPARRVKRIVKFDLPRGAYATALLRALGQ